MFDEFKKFAMRGNVVDLAVGVVIGASFTGIINSLVNDVIMPPIGLALGGVDFSNFFVVLKGDRMVDTLAAAKAAKDVTINYGLFINAIINFLIIAFVLFLLLRQINKLVAPKPGAEVTPPPSEEILLLRDIRDSLQSAFVKRWLFAALFLLTAAPARADDMSAVASGFYTAYVSLPHTGGIPDATARVRYAPFLSPRLAKLIADGAAAESRFAKKIRNAPPLLEGDLFSSLFEGASSFRLGACGGDAARGQCSVALTYQDPGKKPVEWNDMVLLVNTPAGWKVDDIAYKAGFQFGNTGLLSDTLKMAIAEAP